MPASPSPSGPVAGRPPELIVVAASARAAAHSARRGGLRPIAVDLFADTDLTGCCRTYRVASWADELPPLFAQLPATRWMYGGGLENHPQLIAALMDRHQLCGTEPESLRRVRDPDWLARVLAAHGVRFPPIRATPPPSAFGWLRKPKQSCGGLRIEPAGGTRHRNGEFYYQRRVTGPSYAATFAAADRQCRLVGVARQLIGCRWAGVAGFRYAGSIGPVTVPAALRTALERIGNVLTEQGGVSGLFGLDFICGRDGAPTVIEVNPRFTASMELFDRAWRISLVRWHLDGRLPPPGGVPTDTIHGKAILFARRATRVPRDWPQWIDEWRQTDPPRVADLPAPGTAVAAGAPVLTVFAEAATSTGVLRQLRSRTARARACLHC